MYYHYENIKAGVEKCNKTYLYQNKWSMWVAVCFFFQKIVGLLAV